MATGVYIRTKPAWNKGLKRSPEAIEKTRLTNIGREPWNKGLKGAYSDEYIEKLRKSQIGKKQSLETIEKRVVQFTGEKHHAWKGDSIGKKALHSWVKRQLGIPKECSNCGSNDRPAYDYQWASKNHSYKRNVEDWIRLCVKCHRQYDWGYLKLT